MAWDSSAQAHVITGDLATASRKNKELDNIAILKTSIADDGRINGEIKAYREAVATLSIAAGILAIDVSAAPVSTVSLGSNITSITVTGWTASKATTHVLRLTQDGTGGRTVAWPAGWKWSYGVAPTMTATANKTDIVVLQSDDGGTTIYASQWVVNA